MVVSCENMSVINAINDCIRLYMGYEGLYMGYDGCKRVH